MDFVLCPYDRRHRVLKVRLQYHLLKCRQNYTGPPVKPCPFNATHIIPVQDYSKHVQSCIDCRRVEEHQYEDVQSHGTLGATPFHFPMPQCVDWDSSEAENMSSSPSTSGSSVLGASNSDDDEYYPDYDEHEVPLRGYFYEKRKGELQASNTKCSSSTTENDKKASADSTDKLEQNGKGGPKSKLLELLQTLAKDKAGTNS